VCRSGAAAPTGRTERNVRQGRLRTFENEAEAQQRPRTTVRPLGPLPVGIRSQPLVGGVHPAAGRRSRSPAQGVGEACVGRPARATVAPRDDGQRRRRGAALGALDRLAAAGPGLADLPGPLLVDGLVAPARAPEMGFGAAAVVGGDGVPLCSRRTLPLVRPSAAPDRPAARGGHGSCGAVGPDRRWSRLSARTSIIRSGSSAGRPCARCRATQSGWAEASVPPTGVRARGEESRCPTVTSPPVPGRSRSPSRRFPVLRAVRGRRGGHHVGGGARAPRPSCWTRRWAR
jgi:hypothetical protein